MILKSLILILILISTIKTQNRIRPYSECNTELRVFTENCECTDGYYDDPISRDCLLCPYPLLNCYSELQNQQICEDRNFLSFDHYTSQEAIDYIDNYLINEKKIFELEDYEEFKANRATHAQAIRLTNQTFPEDIDKKLRRYHKASSKYFVPNEKFDEYRELVDFMESLDIFEFIGEFSIIVQSPDQEGKVHRDHAYEDLTSEFVWFRGNRQKQFFAYNHKERERSFITSYLGYFDDYLTHNTYPVPVYSYSIRVTGKFKPHVRQYVAENFKFISESRRKALLRNEEKMTWDQESCDYMIGSVSQKMTLEQYKEYQRQQNQV